MSLEESVTALIAGLKAGDSEKVQKLWERYFKRLVGLARKILQNRAFGAADEEDVALSAFNSFYQRAAQGKFPKLDDRHDLWKLLMTITVRKAIHLVRKERKQRKEPNPAWEIIIEKGPTPEDIVEFKEEFERLLDALDDEKLRQIAVSKLEGHTNAEIAEQFGRSIAFVERKLQLIRRIWSQEHSR